MADIFGRQEQVFGGGLTSDASWMFWGGLTNGGLGMLITQMQIQYQQPVRRIYEIGPWTAVGGSVGQPVYYIAGRPEGTVQISRITGPVAALGGFYRTYGNVCSFMNSLFFVSATGCVNQNNTTTTLSTNASAVTGSSRFDPFLGWYMNGCVITGVGLGAQAQDMMVTENVGLMFVSLRLFTSPQGSGWAWTEL